MIKLYDLNGTPVINDLLLLSDTESGQVTLASGEIQYYKKSPDGTLELFGNHGVPVGSNRLTLNFSKTFKTTPSVVTCCYYSNFPDAYYSVGEIALDKCTIFPSKYNVGNAFTYIAIGRWK